VSKALKVSLLNTFLKDLEREGDTWRLSRPSTFADMMLLHRKKTSNYVDADLLSIVNWGIRYNLCSNIDVSVTKVAFKATQLKLGVANDEIIAAYIRALNIMFDSNTEQKHSSLYELTSELDYIAVIDQLDLTADFNSLINRIAVLALSLLSARQVN
jgi:hypothetical protein